MNNNDKMRQLIKLIESAEDQAITSHITTKRGEEIEVVVSFRSYPGRPSTQFEPEEYAETEITSVKLNGQDIHGDLKDHTIARFNDEIESWMAEQDPDDGYGDYMYDMKKDNRED